MVHQPSIRDLKAIVESYNQAVEEADRLPNGDPVPDSLEVSIDDILPRRDNNDFEPKTNMCPDCEGTGQNRMKNDSAFPGLGYDCERCNGEGAVFEDRDDDDTDGPLVPDDMYAQIVADLAKLKPGYQPGAMGKTSDQPNEVSVMAWNPKTDDEEDMIFNTDTMSFEGSDDDFMLQNPFESINEAASRKDFRMVADLISKIEDPALRQSSAEDHAKMFALQNPRFNRTLFMAAAGAEETVEEDDKPYATMKDGPDKYLFRKDNKQKLVGSADNEPEDGEEELEETDMDKFIREMQIAAGIVVEDEAIEEEVDCEACEKCECDPCECEKVEEGKLPDALKAHQFGAKDDDSDDDVSDDDDSDADKEEVDEDVSAWMKRFDKLDALVNEDCDQDEEKNDDGDCSPFTHADDNVDMVREDDIEEADIATKLGRPDVPKPDLSDMEYEICADCGVTGGHDDNCGELAKLYQEDTFGEDLLLAPKDAPGPEVDAGYQATGNVGGGRDPEADYNADDYFGDERVEPELDRQTDFDAPPRDDGDDSYDMNEEPNDDDRIIDVGDDEDYETYDFDDEFEQMLGGSSDMPGAEIQGGMYEMNDLRRLAGLEKVMEEEIDEIAPVIAAVARGAGAALADKAVDAIAGGDVEEGSAAGAPITDDLVAYNIADEKAYYVMADVLGAELDFGPQDEVLVPLARNDQVLVALDQQGFVKDVDFRVAGEQYEADLQNGYDDRKFSDGQDYFPKGATSQPAVDLGPTAGDQGDNPMSNKMRSIEKDAVYESMKLAYRRHRKA